MVKSGKKWALKGKSGILGLKKTAKTTLMPQLLGEFTCKIDNKGRVRLPAPLLKQLGDAALQGFVLNRGFEQCLTLYPKQAWSKISDELSKLNLYVKKNRAFVRYFFRGATELELDKNTRLLLPKTLLNYAAVEQQLIFFAYFDRIEIWSKEVYETLLEEEPMNFGDLAEEVMGQFNTDLGDGRGIELS